MHISKGYFFPVLSNEREKKVKKNLSMQVFRSLHKYNIVITKLKRESKNISCNMVK